jgi:S1-C subfamily serine protease
MSGQVRSEDASIDSSGRGVRKRGRRVRVAGLAAFAAAALVLSACTTTKTPASSSASVSTTPAGVTLSTPSPNSGSYNPETDPVVQAIQKVEPAVVNVTTNVVEQNPFGGAQVGKGVGTGFIVRSDGILITNWHVVEGGLQIRVRFNDTAPTDLRNKVFGAHVIGGKNASDIAVLQLDGVGQYEPLPTVPLGDSGQSVVGERVIAIGYALALPGGPTVTSGILSSTARTVQVQDENATGGSRTYEDALQTDAAINPGNSGGPLIDLNGNVLGINTAGSNSAQNIGFAIAINSAKSIATESINHPSEAIAYLGVSSQPVSAIPFGAPVNHGAVVAALAPNGPAAKAGMKVGDIITSFNGKSISGPSDLGSAIRALKPGDHVTVEVTHQNGGTATLNVTLGTNPLPSTG